MQRLIMKKSNINSGLRIIKIILLLFFTVITLNSCFSIFDGYSGYEKWKYRRSTHGNRNESINRGVFIKDLQYKSSIKLDSFNVYIEKGYKWGFKGNHQTRLIEDVKYPYQLTFTPEKGLNNIYYFIINKNKFDSIDVSNIYLKQKYLKDTLLIGISKHISTTESHRIGCIKVWDNSASE